jgi:hypothetical protein
LLLATSGSAQEGDPEAVAPGAEEEQSGDGAAVEEPGAADPVDDEGDEPAPPRGGFVPRLDFFFPEGDLDLRASKLANKVFFEGQVQYNFIDGDITAFLRYRYYGFRRTYQITGFDSVEFDSI